MQTLRRSSTSATLNSSFPNLYLSFAQTLFKSTPNCRLLSAKSFKDGNDEWNDAWEAAWLSEDLSQTDGAPWEKEVDFPENSNRVLPSDVDDPGIKALVEDMNESWNERRRAPKTERRRLLLQQEANSRCTLEKSKRDYRLQKQRIHAGLWMKEIKKQEEVKLADPIAGGGDDFERFLDSCSEIFDSPNNELANSKIASSSEFKNKPDGWETTSKAQDGYILEMSQREEDVILQEFERRKSFCKLQIAHFLRRHILCRRRPMDGWKYMIQEIGPNVGKRKDSDSSTKPSNKMKMALDSSLTSFDQR